MPNDSTFKIVEVDINEIDLDRNNPRISLRAAADERACIERLSEGKGDQLLALARDIAEKGLSIDPIVITKKAEKRWTVNDGNRRVAVIKMLRNPSYGPEFLRSRFERIAKNAEREIPRKLECHTTDDVHSVDAYIHRRHTGTGDGEGQLEWSSVEQALYELDHGYRGQHDLSARLLRYCQGEGIVFSHEFQITTLTRILSQDRLKRLGISDIRSNPPKLKSHPELVRNRISIIVDDVNTGRVHVKRGGIEGSVYTIEEQERYLERILAVPAPKGVVSASANGGDADDEADRDDESAEGAGKPGGKSTTASGSSVTSPAKPSWDRPRVIQNKSHQLQIPSEHTKARDIHVELKGILINKAPIAGAFLVRAILELAVDYYVNRRNLDTAAKVIARAEGNGGKPSLGQRMKAAVNDLFDLKFIDRNEKNRLIQMTNKEYLSIETLNQIVHSRNMLSKPREINTFWDEIREFLQRCWTT